MGAQKAIADEFGYAVVTAVHPLDLFWIRADVLKASGGAAPPWAHLEKLAPPFRLSVNPNGRVMDLSRI